ncbi:MAG TPA: response regulator [Anaerolineae bacterium]|nr:response regulator [Anaerolineae bacterium]
MPIFLIADDAPFIRLRLTKLLESAGYEVVAASNGEDVLQLYPLTNPDLVILDIAMPKLDGLKALEKLMEQWPEAQVIMLTALDQEDVVVSAMKLGAKDFITKPYDGEQLLQAVRQIIGSK